MAWGKRPTLRNQKNRWSTENGIRPDKNQANPKILLRNPLPDFFTLKKKQPWFSRFFHFFWRLHFHFTAFFQRKTRRFHRRRRRGARSLKSSGRRFTEAETKSPPPAELWRLCVFFSSKSFSFVGKTVLFERVSFFFGLF